MVFRLFENTAEYVEHWNSFLILGNKRQYYSFTDFEEVGWRMKTTVEVKHASHGLRSGELSLKQALN